MGTTVPCEGQPLSSCTSAESAYAYSGGRSSSYAQIGRVASHSVEVVGGERLVGRSTGVPPSRGFLFKSLSGAS